MSDHVQANRRWECQVKEFQQSDSYRELLELTENRLGGLMSLEILERIQKDLQYQSIEPKKFGDRIIFMSMFNDIDCTKKRNSEQCIYIPNKSRTT